MLLQSFAYGSSFPVVAIPLLLISTCLSKVRPTRFPFELFVLTILFLYGLIGVMNYLMTWYYNNNNTSYIVGIITGLVLVVLDMNTIDFRRRCFSIEKSDAWQFYFIGVLIHVLIVRFIMTSIQKNIKRNTSN